MLSGATGGRGGRALANHLADVKGKNAKTEFIEARHMGARGIREAVAEMTDAVVHATVAKPLLHLHVDPAPGEAWTDADFTAWWNGVIADHGLEGHPLARVRHWTWRAVDVADGEDAEAVCARYAAIHGAGNVRHGRSDDGKPAVEILLAHEHAAIVVVKPDGRPVRLSHDYQRRERLARIFEHDRGWAPCTGGHNRAVAAWLDANGRPDVGAAMRAAGLVDGPRPVAALAPRERAQQERTGVSLADVRRAAWEAFQAPDREAALARHGLRLAAGDEGPVVVDRTGNAHSWARAVGVGAKAAGAKAPGAKAAKAALAALALPPLEQARQAIRDTAPIYPAPVPCSPQEESHAAALEADRRDPATAPNPVRAVEQVGGRGGACDTPGCRATATTPPASGPGAGGRRPPGGDR